MQGNLKRLITIICGLALLGVFVLSFDHLAGKVKGAVKQLV